MLEKTLESPLGCKEIKPVNPKGNKFWKSLEGLMLKFQYFGHLMQRTSSLEKTLMLGKIEGKRRRVWQRMRWLDGIIDLMDMSLSRLWVLMMGLECCNPWSCKASDMIEQLNWSELCEVLPGAGPVTTLESVVPCSCFCHWLCCLWLQETGCFCLFCHFLTHTQAWSPQGVGEMGQSVDHRCLCC